MRNEMLTWADIDRLIDHLIPQLSTEFDAMVMVTRGGIVPGGLLAQALQLKVILTAAVEFPAEMQDAQQNRALVWPNFLQFPEEALLRGQKILVVDDVWGSGRTMTAVRHRITGAAGVPFTCVLHFNPYRPLFGNLRPDFYAAVTDAHIIYPWEMGRGPEAVLLRDF